MKNLLVLVALVAQSGGAGPLMSELARLQQDGENLVSFYRGLATSDFSRRTFQARDLSVSNGIPQEGMVSRDGKDVAFELSADNPYRRYLAIAHVDGSSLRPFESLRSPSYLCWSNDKSRITMVASDEQRQRRLLVFTLSNDEIQEITLERAYVTSQCWSRDGKQVVYGIGDRMFIYDLQQQHSRELGKGTYPSWSPDGSLIAFRDRDAFYTITPLGGNRKLLFEKKHTRSGLTWSPDGKLVAYEALTDHYAGKTDFVARQLRIRRLSDNADEWVSEGADVAYVPNYQWVQRSQDPKSSSSGLISHAP